MYSILLAVKKPDVADHKKLPIYEGIVNTMKNLANKDKTIRLLSEGALLLPLNHGLQDVVDVVNSIKSFPYTYAILTEDCKWHEAVSRVWT